MIRKNDITITGKYDSVAVVKDLIKVLTGLPENRNITVNIYVQSIGEIINSNVSNLNEIH